MQANDIVFLSGKLNAEEATIALVLSEVYEIWGIKNSSELHLKIIKIKLIFKIFLKIYPLSSIIEYFVPFPSIATQLCNNIEYIFDGHSHTKFFLNYLINYLNNN